MLSLQEYPPRRTARWGANLKEFAPSTVQAYTFDDKLYAVPATNEGIVLWYHKDAFAEARPRCPGRSRTIRRAGTGTPSRTWPAPSTGAAGSIGRGTA